MKTEIGDWFSNTVDCTKKTDNVFIQIFVLIALEV